MMVIPNPGSINIPHRNISYLRDPTLLTKIPQVWPAGVAYHDDRQFGPQHIRFDRGLDVGTEYSFVQEGDTTIYSPDAQRIVIDSADDIPQNYYLPSHGGSAPGGGGTTLLRPIVDSIHKILVTYHFNRKDLAWIKMVTRLRKDVTLPLPPAQSYTTSPNYYYKSRGNRYVRNKQKVQQIGRPRYLSDRIWDGRSGISGDHGTIGEFFTGIR
jgi:hypothetical protein